MKKDSILYVVLFTLVICVVFVFLLAMTNEATKDKVAENRLYAEQAAVLDAFGIVYNSPEEALTLYSQRVREAPLPQGSPAEKAYRSETDGRTFYAVRIAGAGLWGTITAIVAADSSVANLAGIQIVSQNETPGLGGRIEEPWFRNQFRGERVGPTGIRVTSGAEAQGTGDSDPNNGVLDGISGASRTSQAMQALINAAIRELKLISGGSK